MQTYDSGKHGRLVEVSPKLDGVYGRATRDGIYSKSGKVLQLPHIQKRLRRYFRKHPDGALEGELFRKKAGVEAISGEVRAGGDAARRVKLHVYPGQADRPWGIGAVRRVAGKAVVDDAGVEKVYARALRKGHEGVVVRNEAGEKFKKKPQQDREWPVVGARAGKKTVLTLQGDDGQPFKVQSAAGVLAKAGDRVSVRHSGLTNSGKPKAAVAYRIRNDHDFSAITPMNSISPKEQAQIDQDRRTLKRGALIAGAGALGGLALLKYSKGGIRRSTPSYPGGGLNLPAPVPRQPSGRGLKVTKTREVIRLPQRGVVKGGAILGPKPPTAKQAAAALPKPPSALDNQTRKGGTARAVKVADLREQRAYAALKPSTPAKLAKVKPADREKYAALDARARAKAAARLDKPVFEPADTLQKNGLPKRVGKRPGVISAGEAQASAVGALKLDRLARQRTRQELLKFRQQKNFMTPASRLIDFKERDRGDTLRDVAVGGGALASGGGALYAARKFGRASEAATGAANAVKETAARFTPKEIAHAVGAEVTAKTRKTLKGYFPTFIKGGKKVSALLQKSFSTPASRLIEFGNDNQVRDPDTRRYNDPLKVAAGFQQGYTRKDASNQPIMEDLPLLHAQVIKSAYNKGKKIQRTASRGGALVKDVSDTVRGKPRAKDAAGRVKKKEWEKGWFKEGAKNAAVGAGLLGSAAYLSKHPEKRAAITGAARKATEWANKKVPDLFKAFGETQDGKTQDAREEKHFATPAGGLFQKLRGPSAAAKAGVASREALLGKIQSRVRLGGPGADKAARVAGRVKKNLAGKKAKVKLAERYRKEAIGSVKKGAVIAGGGALAGGALMKAHADQPEKTKVERGARLRNALVGAAAGSFLGGGLAGGASGFKGARVGAALGGIAGLLTNPKRRVAIDELQTASFETPAGRLIEFGKAKEDEGSTIPLLGIGGGYAGAYAGGRVKRKIDKATMAKGNDAAPQFAVHAERVFPGSMANENQIAKRLAKRVDPAFTAKHGRVATNSGVKLAARARYQEVGRRKLEKLHQIASGKTGLVRESAGAADRIGNGGARKMVKLNKAGKRAVVPLRKRVMAKALLTGAKYNKPGLIQGVGLVGGLVAGVGAGIYGDRKIKAVWEKKNFETPAGRLIEFDRVAADAGWDIRDPRGKSARVFAPGSRQRVRREKEWYEKTGNERKLWKAGLLAAGVAGLAGGAALGRRFPKAPKVAVTAAKAATVDPEMWPAWRRA